MKHIAKKVCWGIAAFVTLFWGVMSTAQYSAAQEEATGSLKIIVWYMVLQSLLFVVLSVVTMLRITANKKTASIQKGLYAVAAAIAGLYSLLLTINLAPQIPSLFTGGFWKQSGVVVAFFERVLYLLQGILLTVLSADMLRGKLKRRGELTWIATVCIMLLLIPYGLQFSGVGLFLVMTAFAGAILALLTVCQASVVYVAFVPMEE